MLLQSTLILRLSLLILQVTATVAAQTPSSPLKGDVSAVYDLLDRVLPGGGRRHFQLSLVADQCCGEAPPCFCLQDNNMSEKKNQDKNDKAAQVVVTASSASELSAGIGWYLRHYCNMTIGWPRGGGSHVFSLSDDETGCSRISMEQPEVRRRIVPYTYFMNVCTHSYSLVWYNWTDWEQFIDWMSLSGINLILALTGQEEIQYKVLQKLGLSDIDIRSWFNGPAFLAWSRGQNEYDGNRSICGPLPRSWMKDQWNMQRHFILPRLRSLGITGQLPGFQGNVPVQLKDLYHDANMTAQDGTGWIDALDPLYGQIADLWMETLIQDFGTDHWYQLDGYFNGGTAPWVEKDQAEQQQDDTIVADQQRFLLEDSDVTHDESWFRRGVQVYTGLNRTDPDAIWAYQGFAFNFWTTQEQAMYVKGLVDSAPLGKFVITDMDPDTGRGEWTKWSNASFFGAPFVWTALRNFGGNDGIKGSLEHANRIPFAAMEAGTSIVGVGATPEGIDQNPAYYEFLFEQNFRTAPVPNLTAHMVAQSQRRYGCLVNSNDDVAQAWSLLVDSAYAYDNGVQDNSGIPNLHPDEASFGMFEKDRFTPKPVLCKIFAAWQHLMRVAAFNRHILAMEPFVYDLVNVGREVLAQIATPAALNFSEATERDTLYRDEIEATGSFYIQLLHDTDTLVATDSAFLLGPWLESARRWGNGTYDCESPILLGHLDDASSDDNVCKRFYEWNSRTQLTTWNPTAKGSTRIPKGPIDYASKQWSGLIKDYYGKRASILRQQALRDQEDGVALNQTEVARLFALHAYEWTTSANEYPASTTGGTAALAVSQVMHEKYKGWFASCSEGAASLVKSKIITPGFPGQMSAF